MPFPSLAVNEHDDLDAFVAEWAPRYVYAHCALYEQVVGEDPPAAAPNQEEMVQLFTWKNGCTLSQQKLNSVQDRFAQHQTEVPNGDIEAAPLATEICGGGGPIFRVFYFHLHSPADFPVFDQHVARAMRLILGWPIINWPRLSASQKAAIYAEEYRPWFNARGFDHRRQLDKALWALGKFSSSWGHLWP